MLIAIALLVGLGAGVPVIADDSPPPPAASLGKVAAAWPPLEQRLAAAADALARHDDFRTVANRARGVITRINLHASWVESLTRAERPSAAELTALKAAYDEIALLIAKLQIDLTAIEQSRETDDDWAAGYAIPERLRELRWLGRDPQTRDLWEGLLALHETDPDQSLLLARPLRLARRNRALAAQIGGRDVTQQRNDAQAAMARAIERARSALDLTPPTPQPTVPQPGALPGFRRSVHLAREHVKRMSETVGAILGVLDAKPSGSAEPAA